MKGREKALLLSQVLVKDGWLGVLNTYPCISLVPCFWVGVKVSVFFPRKSLLQRGLTGSLGEDRQPGII